MRRTGKRVYNIQVDAPARGVINRLPDNIADKELKQAASYGENVRYEDGVTRNAPGYEVATIFPTINEPINLIFQASTSNQSGFNTSPILGTTSKLYAVSRQASNAINIDAGTQDTVYDSTEYNLSASFYKPSNDTSTYTYLWTQQSGPSTVVFGSATDLISTVTVSAGGIYIFQIEATNGDQSVSDTVQIAFYGSSPIAVNAGDDQSILFLESTATFTLSGSVSGDSSGLAAVLWTQVTGPAAAIIANPNSLSTSVEVSAIGEYVFRLQASNGLFVGEDSITITATELSGLLWRLPCYISTEGGTTCTCDLNNETDGIVSGSPTDTYEVTLRFRGVVEGTSYEGGVDIGNLNIGGDNSGGYNVYQFITDSPELTANLNQFGEDTDWCNLIDFTYTFTINGGSGIKIFSSSFDAVQRANSSENGHGNPLSVPDDDPDHPIQVSQPYNGQFIQVDVMSVTKL